MTASNVKLVKDGLTVTIMTEMDEENLTKNLILIPFPKSYDNQETDTSSSDYGANATKILDILMKAEQRITIDGFLIGGTITGDSSSTASGRKADLKKIFLGGGKTATTMTYEGSSFEVAIDKLSIKREDKEGANVGTGDIEYSVKLTCIRGEGIGR